MSQRAGLLFPAALGVSAAAHLLMLFLWPYSPVRPARLPPEPIAVRLLQAPRPAPLAAPKRQAVRPEPQIPAPEPAPLPQQPEPAPQPPAEAPLELAPPAPETAVSPQAVEGESPATTDGSTSLAGEIAATQAVLVGLRARIAEKLRYPALARANNWQGKVLLQLALDQNGRLLGLAVRRSSGYAVLDRAAAAVLRSVTPVDNPLGRPLQLDFEIAYELKD